VALLLASGFGLGGGLLLPAGRFVLFLRLLFVSFDKGGVQCLRINFIEARGIRQWVVVFVYGRAPGSADEHGLKDERSEFGSVHLLVKRPCFLGHLPIASVFRILQAVAFGKAARQFVRQRTQDKLCDHAQFFGSELRLYPLEHVGQKAVPSFPPSIEAAVFLPVACRQSESCSSRQRRFSRDGPCSCRPCEWPGSSVRRVFLRAVRPCRSFHCVSRPRRSCGAPEWVIRSSWRCSPKSALDSVFSKRAVRCARRAD
jgi:hypothetical protein